MCPKPCKSVYWTGDLKVTVFPGVCMGRELVSEGCWMEDSAGGEV